MRFEPVEKRCSTLVFIREGLRWCCKEMFIRRHFYTFNQLVKPYVCTTVVVRYWTLRSLTTTRSFVDWGFVRTDCNFYLCH